ncbi:MAG TPA: hypothetical protein VG248_06185 [Caulobacteraceae bacterium]|jgi:hypothetical protein|nr:hypothetical protein [Caulobacteraceae bacterium]
MTAGVQARASGGGGEFEYSAGSYPFYIGYGRARTGGNGAGSFNGGANQQVLGFNGGAGFVRISDLSVVGDVPGPSTWSLLITGFGFLGYVLRARMARAARAARRA